MMLLLAGLALADPVAQRSPVQGDVVGVVGAPHLGVGWRVPTDEAEDVAVMLSAAIRVPAASTDLSLGLAARGGAEERGWGWAAGTSMGIVVLRDPEVALSVAPWARLERRGPVHGGVQVAAPMVGARTGGLRLPVLGELFVGSQRERVSVLAVAGAGWAFLPRTPAGALIVQGSVQLGFRLP